MILAILQARMSSSRLAGKVLMPILGEPMLARQIERIRRSRKIDQLIVATSVESSDDAIEHACLQLRTECYRGSLNDVLDRFYHAAAPVGAQTIVRLTADCPLFDAGVADETIEQYRSGSYDYVSNCLVPTFPDGLDTEVMSFAALERAFHEAAKPSEREHVTPYIWNHPELFRVNGVQHTMDLSAYRWSVDYPEDFEFTEEVFQALYQAKPDFRMNDILKFLDSHPEVRCINDKRVRNEGYQKSVLEDRAQNTERE